MIGNGLESGRISWMERLVAFLHARNSSCAFERSQDLSEINYETRVCLKLSLKLPRTVSLLLQTSFCFRIFIVCSPSREFDSKAISMKQFQERLEQIILIHREIIPMMEIEDDDSYAHEISQRSRKNVHDLKDLIRFAEFL